MLRAYCSKNKGPTYARIVDQDEKKLCLDTQLEAMIAHLARATREGESADVLASICFDMGNAYVAQETWQDAIDSFRQALVQFPLYMAALVNLAASHERAGELEAAARTHARMLTELPDSAPVWTRLASVHLRMNNVDTAHRYFEYALKVGPNYAPALAANGAMMAQEERFDEAVSLFQRAIAADPAQVRAYQNLAIVYLKTGNVRGATTYVAKGLAVAPDDALLREIESRLKTALINPNTSYQRVR